VRHWPERDPQPVVPFHVHAAATDSFSSDSTLQRLDEFRQSTRFPHEPGRSLYGRAGSRHGWQPITHAELVQTMAQPIAPRAPAGENPSSWHY
jgi:hypothetical protein